MQRRETDNENATTWPTRRTSVDHQILCANQHFAGFAGSALTSAPLSKGRSGDIYVPWPSHAFDAGRLVDTVAVLVKSSRAGQSHQSSMASMPSCFRCSRRSFIA